MASKTFTESRILAETMAQLIEENTDISVERKINLGGTLMVFSALESGQVDVYPEYTGTAWAILLEEREPRVGPLEVWLRVSRACRKRFGLEWLLPFGFRNSYALAVRRDLAEELGLSRISDLLPHQERLRAGVSHEFLNRSDGFPGLAAAYGLEVGNVRGLEHGLAYRAIAANEVDLIDVYTTDGRLVDAELVMLDDDRHFFPPYDCAPVIRAEILRSHPEVRDLLERLAFRISNARMQRLNHAVEVEGRSFQHVARELLREEGLLDPAIADEPASTRNVGFLEFMGRRVGTTVSLTTQHLLLTLAAVTLAIVVSIPLGILLTRKERLASPVLTIAGIIQTVPGLALLAIMIPIPLLGLGLRSAITALFLYSLLPIIRNTYTGIREVDADVVEAARGMGLTDRQVLMYVELPLATRTIMAGIRIATVVGIGLATLAAFIGAGGLGEPIVTGLQLDDTNLILSGALPAALLAIICDIALSSIERRLARHRSS